MKTIFKTLSFLFWMIPITMFAQTSVSGTVTGTSDGLPIPGVNIIVQGSTNGTTTDFDGNYTLTGIKSGDLIVYSYVGYSSEKVNYTDQKRINISMQPDSELEEIILIGYGSSTKQDVTGAVETISAKEFNQGAIVSPDQLLAGKTAGVRITSAGGAPGGGAQIRIRGGASLTGNSDPLIVVDGIPLDQRGVQGARNQLNAINPNEIKDFVVLKDAAATAIYGSRASNGVILITTKSGSNGAPLSVEYDGKVSIGVLNNTVDVLNASEFRSLVENTEGTDLSLLGNSNTDWQDEIYRTAVGTIQNITIAKGFKSTSFRLNYNHTNQNGLLKRDEFTRDALNLSVKQDLFNDDLTLTLSSKNSLSENFFANNDAIGAAVRFDPTQSVFDPNSPFDGGYFEFLDGENAQVNAPRNPVGLLEQDDNIAKNKRTITNFNLNYDFPFLEGLRFNLNAGIDYSELDQNQFKPKDAGQNFQNIDFRKVTTGINRNQLLDFYLNYKTTINPINTNIDVTAGHSYQEFYRATFEQETVSDNFITREPSINRNALESYFGRASFDIANRYILSGSIRRDGSSRFSEDNRWGIFPAASFGWKISNENFLKNSSAISNLKLRAGWGVTGQQEINDNFAFLGLFTPGEDGAQVQFGNQFINTLRPEEFDQNIKWEELTTYNVGLDFGFIDDRITGSVDAYYRETKDLLARVPTPAGSNLSDILTTNVGQTVSRGIEVGLNGKIFNNENFQWDLGYNITFSDVEISNLTLGNDPDFQIPQGGIAGGVGNNIQIWKEGYDPTTFFVFRQIYDNAGNPVEGAYVDINGDNEITEDDKTPFKQANPNMFMGLTSNMTYKNFDFSFTFRGSFGGYNYNNIQSSTGYREAFTNTPGDYYQNGSSDVNVTNFENAQLFSDRYVQSADFVRLDNMSLGYNIPGDEINCRLSFTANNLFTITNYDGIDPELFVTDAFSSKVGIDDRFYPRPTTFVIGVNFKY